MTGLKELHAKIKNLLMKGQFSKRNDDGTIQLETRFGRVLDNMTESFPYGFYAKAKAGSVTVLCVAGSLDAVEVLPIENSDFVPKLQDADVAMYTEGGSSVICREDGTVEVNGTQKGGVVIAKELQTQLDKMTARIDGIIDALKKSPTVPQDGGSAYKAAIVALLETLINKEDFSTIENKKVQHGTGAD